MWLCERLYDSSNIKKFWNYCGDSAFRSFSLLAFTMYHCRILKLYLLSDKYYVRQKRAISGTDYFCGVVIVGRMLLIICTGFVVMILGRGKSPSDGKMWYPTYHPRTHTRCCHFTDKFFFFYCAQLYNNFHILLLVEVLIVKRSIISLNILFQSPFL